MARRTNKKSSRKGNGRMNWTDEQRTVVHLLWTQFDYDRDIKANIFNHMFPDELRTSGYTQGMTGDYLRDQYEHSHQDGRSKKWLPIVSARQPARVQREREDLKRRIRDAAAEIDGEAEEDEEDTEIDDTSGEHEGEVDGADERGAEEEVQSEDQPIADGGSKGERVSHETQIEDVEMEDANDHTIGGIAPDTAEVRNGDGVIGSAAIALRDSRAHIHDEHEEEELRDHLMTAEHVTQQEARATYSNDEELQRTTSVPDESPTRPGQLFRHPMVEVAAAAFSPAVSNQSYTLPFTTPLATPTYPTGPGAAASILQTSGPQLRAPQPPVLRPLITQPPVPQYEAPIVEAPAVPSVNEEPKKESWEEFLERVQVKLDADDGELFPGIPLFPDER